MSLLDLNQGVKHGKRESEIASLALELGYHRLLLADVLLAFMKATLGQGQACAEARQRSRLPSLWLKATEPPWATPHFDRLVRLPGRAKLKSFFRVAALDLLHIECLAPVVEREDIAAHRTFAAVAQSRNSDTTFLLKHSPAQHLRWVFSVPEYFQPGRSSLI